MVRCHSNAAEAVWDRKDSLWICWPKRVVLCIGVLEIDTPDLKNHLASRPRQRYNTPNLNMRESPSNQATAVLLRLVKKGSLTTCKTTDSVGVHGNSGNKSVKK